MPMGMGLPLFCLGSTACNAGGSRKETALSASAAVPSAACQKPVRLCKQTKRQIIERKTVSIMLCRDYSAESLPPQCHWRHARSQYGCGTD